MFGYGWDRGLGYGFGRGFGYGHGCWGPGNLVPHCRAYPRGWWKWGYGPENIDYYPLVYRYPYQYSGYNSVSEVTAMRDTLKQISDMLVVIEKRLSELEKVQK